MYDVLATIYDHLSGIWSGNLFIQPPVEVIRKQLYNLVVYLVILKHIAWVKKQDSFPYVQY